MAQRSGRFYPVCDTAVVLAFPQLLNVIHMSGVAQTHVKCLLTAGFLHGG